MQLRKDFEFINHPDQTLLHFMHMVVDGGLTIFAFLCAFRMRQSVLFSGLFPIFPIENYLWLAIVSVPTTITLYYFSGLYSDIKRIPNRTIISIIVKSSVFQLVFLGSLIFFFQSKIYSRSLFGLFIVFHILIHLIVRFCWKIISQKMTRFRSNPERVLLVGINQRSRDLYERIVRHPEWNLEVTGFMSVQSICELDRDFVPPRNLTGKFEDLEAISKKQAIDEIIFCLDPAEICNLRFALKECEELGIRAHILADLFNMPLAQPQLNYLDDVPLLSFTTTPHRRLHLAIKRILDISVSSALLLLFLFPMTLIALAIRLDSSGPILFSQMRVGKNGRRFRLYKFRSMIRDAEVRKSEYATLNEMSGPVFKSSIDPRITRVGHWIRKYSLDELPQLFNVILGDMSLVGPRPALPDEILNYKGWQRRRVSMKPGLTCIWQISGRNEVDFEEWMKMDLDYLDHWSLSLDLVILLKTIPAVIFTRGAH